MCLTPSESVFSFSFVCFDLRTSRTLRNWGALPVHRWIFSIKWIGMPGSILLACLLSNRSKYHPLTCFLDAAPPGVWSFLILPRGTLGYGCVRLRAQPSRDIIMWPECCRLETPNPSALRVSGRTIYALLKPLPVSKEIQGA